MPYQDYKILSFIGKGGYGEVYKVQHVSTGDVYAMKTVSNKLNSVNWNNIFFWICHIKLLKNFNYLIFKGFGY